MHVRTPSAVSRCLFSTAVSLLVACGSGSSSNPATASKTVTLSNTASVIPLPPVGTYTENLNLPAGTPVGSQTQTTISTQVPVGLPTPPSSVATGPQSGRQSESSAAPTPLAFLQLTNATSAAEVFAAYPGFSITTAGTATFPSGTYESEVYDSANASVGWVKLGTAVLVAPTLTFTGPQGIFTLAAGDTVTLALLVIPQAASGVITLSPATTASAPYALTVGGNVTLTAVESGYSGTFTAVSQNTGFATVMAQGSSQNLFTVTGAGNGTTLITVKDSANNSASFYVTVSTASSGTGSFTIDLPAQQNMAVAIPTISGSNVSSGTVTFPTANGGNPYPAGTVVTVTLSNSVPPGFGYTPPGPQVFGMTFTSNNTITSATLSSLPAVYVVLANSLGGSGLQGELLAPPTAFGSANCQIFGGTDTWTINAQPVSQGLTAGTANGYDFYAGAGICLP
jgi:hypothetical protein